MVDVTLVKGQLIAEKSDKALELVSKQFGAYEKGMIYFSLYEGYYLMEKGKINVIYNNKPISKEEFLKKISRVDKRFLQKAIVFYDLRSKGYIVKTALKYGAEFRVYDKGIIPGKDHAKWIVYPVMENEKFSWHEFAAKNRVAHSTRKKLMLGIVDEELKVTYYEIGWVKP